jgi:hypothetical protein
MNGTELEASSPEPSTGSDSVASPVEAPDNIWDALNQTYEAMHRCNSSPSLLLESLRDQALIEKVSDKKTLHSHAAVLARDVEEYTNRLATIHRNHANRTGSSANIDEQLQAIQIHERYIQWSESYSAVVLPNVAAVVEILQDAGATLDAERLLTSNPVVEMDKMLTDQPDLSQDIPHG